MPWEDLREVFKTVNFASKATLLKFSLQIVVACWAANSWVKLQSPPPALINWGLMLGSCFKSLFAVLASIRH